MTNTKINYHIIIQGNDIHTKSASKLKHGDFLKFTRLNDELDTYELVLSTSDDKELDMLSYEDSFTIAPFIDEKTVIVNNIIVTNVSLTSGKTRANDQTRVDFTADITYDETMLYKYISSHKEGFIPLDNIVQAMASYCLLDYEQTIITQTHLNRFELDIDIDEDSCKLFDFNFEENINYFFNCEVLLNPEFTHCKINAKVYTENNEYPLELSEDEKFTMLNLVNHYLILNDEEAIDPELDN